MVKRAEWMVRLLEDAEVGEINLAPPLSSTEVLEFERTHGVVLPDEYRSFLLRVGSTCSEGPPDYGLLRLGELPADYHDRDLHERVSEEFSLTEPLRTEDGLLIAKHERGVLNLGTDGCGMYWILVVSGPARGTLWMLSEMGIQPWYGRSFGQWMLHWREHGADWWSG